MDNQQHADTADPHAEYLQFISNFSGEFTVGAVKRPIGDVSQWFSEGNPPIEVHGPTTDDSQSYEVYPSVILTQAVDSDWTLILYCLGYFLPRAEDHIEILSKALSADAILHAFEDTSGVEEINFLSSGNRVYTYRNAATEDIVNDLRESMAEHMNAPEDTPSAEANAGPSPRDRNTKIVSSYGAVYDELGICPIAAAVDASMNLHVEATSADRLESVVVYDFRSFQWRGLVDVAAKWAERIDLDSFEFSKVYFGYTKADSLVLEKSKETIEGREIIQTKYFFATDKGLEPLDKRAASDLLTACALVAMNRTKKMIRKTEGKKQYKNGNVDLVYRPSKYDQFTLKLSKSNVGRDVDEFLQSLSAARHKIQFGSVEPAKSGRSTCQTCNKKIDKGDLRIGEYHEDYYEYPPSQWHHARCIEFADATRLHKYAQLTDDQQAELAKLLDS